MKIKLPANDGRALMARLSIENKGAPRQLKIVDADQGGAIYIYDIIDEFWGVSASSVIEALNSISAESVDVHINSPGGSVFEARAIVSALRGSGKRINTFVDGVAASAASWIATAGQTVTMAKGSFLMIHQSWGLAYGNAGEMRATADLLEKIDGTILDEYEAKTGQSREQLNQWLVDETWFTADEAKDAGFADVVSGSEASNSWNLSAYKNAPSIAQPSTIEDEIDWQAMNRRARAAITGIA